MTPERSRLLMYTGCFVIVAALLGLAAGVTIAIYGSSHGVDWLLYCGIGLAALSTMVAAAGSVTNMVGFVHQITERWRAR